MVREVLREFLRVAWPEAFCIIALRIVRLGLEEKEEIQTCR